MNTQHCSPPEESLPSCGEVTEERFREMFAEIDELLKEKDTFDKPLVSLSLQGEKEMARLALQFMEKESAVPSNQIPMDMHTFTPASRLLDRPSVARLLTQLIAKRFPKGDAAAFSRHYVHNPHAQVHCLHRGQEILLFTGTERIPGAIPHYVDWACGNPDASIKGQYLPFMKDIFSTHPTFHANKPHVTLPLALKAGAVCDDVAAPGEYQDPDYLLSFCDPFHMRQYPLKTEDPLALRSTLQVKGYGQLQPGDLRPFSFARNDACVCRVTFTRKPQETKPEENNAWFYQTVKDLCRKKNQLLLSMIPDANATALRQIYYCIFGERSKIHDRLRLDEARQARREHHGVTPQTIS